MNSVYEILFSVKFYHEYYKNQLCNDFEIVPAQDTEKILKGQKIIYRNLGSEFVTGIEAEGSSPKISLPENLLLRFYMISQNSLFGNFTSLNLEKQKGRVYYFSNIAGNSVNNNLYLSKPISVYNSMNAYIAGDFASDIYGNVFEAIQNNSSSDQHYLSETDYWKPAGQNQYASSNDLILNSTGQLSFVLSSPSNTAETKIFSYNSLSHNYDLTVYSETKSFSSTQDSVLVDLSRFNYGKYKINVNGKEEFVYYDINLAAGNVFGVVEIFHNSFVNTDYKLLDGSGNLKEPVYTIKFRNRSTFWKYIARTSNVTSITEITGEYNFSSIEPQRFISDKPIPLSEANLSINLETSNLGEIDSIKNPSIDLVNQFDQNGNKYYCSEIFLNY